MNTKPNFAHEIAQAEALGDSALLAAIARQLLAERWNRLNPKRPSDR